jgi:hypothetical protein
LTKIIRFAEFVNILAEPRRSFGGYELGEDTTEVELHEYAIERMFD